MSCKFASSSSSSSSNVYLLTKSNRLTKITHFPKSISFSSQVTKTRIISIRNPSGSRRARPTMVSIKAFYAPAECEESLYELLGVAESGSTLSDIKKAYKQMARKYHPDVSPPDRVDEHTRKFIMLKEAYETLSNPQRRALYDRDLAHQGVGIGFSPRKSCQYYDQRMEEKEEWKTRWHSQLDELKMRNTSKNPSKGRMSWGARMRAQR